MTVADQADSALAALPVPSDTSLVTQLSYQTERADLAVTSARNWRLSFEARTGELTLVTQQRDRLQSRVIALEALRDEGIEVVSSGGKLFGILPRPHCGVGVALGADLKVRPAIACTVGF